MYELHAACKAGDLELVKKLIREDHDPYEADKDGMFSMSYAAMGNHYEVVAYLVNHLTQSEPTPNAITTQRAANFCNIGNLFAQCGHLDSAAEAYKTAIGNFERIKNRSDEDTRNYLGCLRNLLQLAGAVNAGKVLVELNQKILLAFRTLRVITEEDRYCYDCTTQHNLAQARRRTGEIEQAIPAYIESIAQFPSFSKPSVVKAVHEAGHTFIRILAQCFESNSFARGFCEFAADCLSKDADVASKMNFLINNPQKVVQTHRTLCELGMALIDTLLHHHKLSVLQNESLQAFFKDNSNIQKLKTLRDLLDKKLNPTRYNQCLAFFGGFTDMDDQTVPLDLDYTHPWTERPPI